MNDDRSATAGYWADPGRAYRQLFERSPLPMWLYDVASVRFLAVNQATSTCYGYSRDELLTMTVHDILAPGETPRMNAILALAPLPRTGPMLWRHRRRNGELFDAEIVSEPIDLDGHRARVVLAREVTQALRAEAELRASERRYRSIVETATEGIWLIDAQARTTFVNAAMADMLGYIPAQMQGRAITDFMDAEGRALAEQHLARRRQGQSEQHEFRFVHRSGRDMWVAISTNPLLDDAGAYAGALAMVTDITERRRAALREAGRNTVMALVAGGALLQTVLEAVVRMIEREQPGALCSILLLDRTGTRLRTGAGPSLPAGYLAALDGEGVGAGAGACGRAAATGRRVVCEDLATDALWQDHRSLAADAGLRACWSEPIVSRAGAVLGTFAVYRRQPWRPDATEIGVVEAAAHMAAIAIERQLTEEALRDSQKMESLGTLAGGIAHDFNNILGAILGNLSLLQQDAAAGGIAHMRLQQIHHSALRARALVQQILAFSRRQPHALVSQPLRPLVEEALVLLRASLPAGVRLQASLADDPLHIRADATQMHQVLMNLCSNAWHAMNPDGGRIEVGLAPVLLDTGTAQRLGGLAPGPHAHLWVADNGSGMDEATRAHCFEPFFTTKPVGVGTGLGLAVVHGIVGEHFGAIGIDTAPGVGTTFHLYFPCAEVAGAEAAAAAPRPAQVPRPGQGEHILCIDDDEVMLLTDEGLLCSLGYRVTTHRNGHEALAAVQRVPGAFDLVVSDVNMPEMSGLDVARELARIAPALPVILCSGYITEALQTQALQLGVRGLVHKENTVEELGPLVQQVLGTRALRSPPAR